MQANTITFSRHAYRRLAQRNLTTEDVQLVCQFGIHEHRAGVVCYFLGKRHLRALDNAKRLERLEGVTVLCCPRCHCIVTAYHNKRGIKAHKHKPKYDHSADLCSYCGA